MQSSVSPRWLTATASLLLACGALSAQETFAKYSFVNSSLRSTDNNPAVDASDLAPNRPYVFYETSSTSNICLGSEWRSSGGYLELTFEPSNRTDHLNVGELYINYAGGAGGHVNRLKVTADEEPGPGGDNFATVLFQTTNLDRDLWIDLSGVAFLQGTAGPITLRLNYDNTSSHPGNEHFEIDQIKVTGTRTTPPNGPTNPCVGPLVYFDSGWQNSSYVKNGNTPQWFFPRWSNDYDVACIDETGSTHVPAIWSNSCTVGCRKLEFNIKGRSGDDDSIGFVLGFCDGDQNDPNADYLAVIWNGNVQTAQFPNHCASVTKPKGLHLVRVRGIPDPAEFFGQTNLSCTPSSSRVDLLAEANNLGNSSWPADTARAIRVEMEPNRLRIWVQGTLEFDRAGDYSEYLQGCFGYYAQSQFADFWGLESTPLNPVTASWNTYGDGTPGCAGVPSIGMVNRPVLGTVGLVAVGNAGTSTATCALFVSLTPANLFLPLLGGPLNVGLPLAGVVPLSVPPGGTVFECAVPDDSCVAGVSLFWQAICIDPCGPAGFAMTPGLEIIFGDY